jgi:hypothetical protein
MENEPLDILIPTTYCIIYIIRHLLITITTALISNLFVLIVNLIFSTSILKDILETCIAYSLVKFVSKNNDDFIVGIGRYVNNNSHTVTCFRVVCILYSLYLIENMLYLVILQDQIVVSFFYRILKCFSFVYHFEVVERIMIFTNHIRN